MNRSRAFALLMLILVAYPRFAAAESNVSFRADLRQFGYIEGRNVAEYSTLCFLSDDLVLVSVNQRVIGGVHANLVDEPPSTLVLFDLKQKQVSRTLLMTIVKAPRSVVPLTNGKFVGLSRSDLKLCSAELLCEKSFPAIGGLTGVDQNDLQAWVGADNADRYVIRHDSISTDGTRTLSSELYSTTWNKIMHPLDIDEPSPPNVRRVTLHDNQSGKTLLSLQYNPRNHVVGPALSPNGTRLALVRKGALEIYEIPRVLGVRSPPSK